MFFLLYNQDISKFYQSEKPSDPCYHFGKETKDSNFKSLKKAKKKEFLHLLQKEIDYFIDEREANDFFPAYFRLTSKENKELGPPYYNFDPTNYGKQCSYVIAKVNWYLTHFEKNYQLVQEKSFDNCYIPVNGVYRAALLPSKRSNKFTKYNVFEPSFPPFERFKF